MTVQSLGNQGSRSHPSRCLILLCKRHLWSPRCSQAVRGPVGGTQGDSNSYQQGKGLFPEPWLLLSSFPILGGTSLSIFMRLVLQRVPLNLNQKSRGIWSGKEMARDHLCPFWSEGLPEQWDEQSWVWWISGERTSGTEGFFPCQNDAPAFRASQHWNQLALELPLSHGHRVLPSFLPSPLAPWPLHPSSPSSGSPSVSPLLPAGEGGFTGQIPKGSDKLRRTKLRF